MPSDTLELLDRFGETSAVDLFMEMQKMHESIDINNEIKAINNGLIVQSAFHEKDGLTYKKWLSAIRLKNNEESNEANKTVFDRLKEIK